MKEFDSARDSLKHLIREFQIKKIYIPYYLCDVIRHAIFEENCKPLFYHIKDDFMPAIEFPKDAYILYPNYFGICSRNAAKLVETYPRLIVDNAHAFYAKPSGFASFNSAKKFLPVEGGSYLFFGDEDYAPKLDYQRRERFELFHKKYRKTNLLKIDIAHNDIPFCYPYLAKNIEDADNMVKELTQSGLIIYRYWNALPESYNEYKFYSRLVPIPVGC